MTVKSADNPDSLRGAGLDGVVMDEAAFMAREAWSECVRPALADRQGWALFLTTPCVTNWLYDVFQAAATTPGWARWQRPTSDNPRVPAAELDAARQELGTYAFSQEFEAQFLTPGGGLFKTEWFGHRYEPAGEGHFALEGGTTVTLGSLRTYATVDLAASLKTTADFTVVLVAGIAPDGRMLVLEVDRARREGPDQIPAIERAVERWNLSAVWIEKVGFQLALVQQAWRAGLPVRELSPDRDKVARALPATAAMEGGRVLLPRQAPWLRDFEAELLGFASYERQLIKARTRAALALKKARGERTGGVPMGSRVGEDGRLEVNGVEAAAVARARALRAEGSSLREIATRLEAEGHRPRGRRWHVQTLARVVAGEGGGLVAPVAVDCLPWRR